ncbi:hypothetical protein FKR81_36930 [Lentzea tibetensis]|uniref:ARB-07466-like C-terminal domain-containing protein n=1 Tax=Lentzea tibetensis TaxID=2591470 RepID=A0A563EHM9_9PSEU|nr:hypothetical protein [Lentzea tibetensis]TWP46120.1 hypothetical protein FKR81_36930 [Lentzea tibetensis]
MSGRHRTKQTASRKLPIAVAATLTVGLVVTFWAVRVFDQPVDPAGAVANLAAPSIPVSQVTTSTTAPPSSQPPATTTAPPVTTTAPETTTPPPVPPPAPPCPTTLDGAKPHAAQVGHHLDGKFDVNDIGGAAGRAGDDHALGLALDFMVNTVTGNALADHVLANRKAFGVTYVIWRQRINDGSGWKAMEDRGSPTANHMDHVHVSFQANATVNVTC